ncbi:hypothetical protein HWV62_3737 [Athelia sp. TMB]|nr:hypothetical protein HWV62_3737 [Athelia sp. TMB]
MDEKFDYDLVPPESSNIPGPAPDQRHAQPSGPWPWQDIEALGKKDTEVLPPLPPNAPKWRGYPQCDFPNWTPSQVRRSGIRDAIDKEQDHPCRIYCVDIMETGYFETRNLTTIHDTPQSKTAFWEKINAPRPEGIRVRSLCIENLSGPVLQMLGHRYTVEPFFWSSSLNWLPSRYQEIVPRLQGDHITIALTFLRTVPDPATVLRSRTSFNSTRELPSLRGDPQASLTLSSSQMILRQDLLSVHMIRSPQGSTIISYHPDPQWRTTSARVMHSRIALAGESVYWQNIVRRVGDPTFILLTILWHALYSWDQALEQLYAHISWLEAKVIRTNDTTLSSELHIIRAHLLHYDSLLNDFEKSIKFVRDTSNPAMDAIEQDPAEKAYARSILMRECSNLLSEIERLERSRDMQNKRLKNVMNLSFNIVNTEDSKRMQKLTEAARDDNTQMKALTEAAVSDSAAMKQIAYLSMIFLPASFVAGVFGMNVVEINPGTNGTLSHYAATAIPLTIVTIWLIIAFQSKKYFAENEEPSLASNLMWPWKLAKRIYRHARGVPNNGRKRNDDLPR